MISEREVFSQLLRENEDFLKNSLEFTYPYYNELRKRKGMAIKALERITSYWLKGERSGLIQLTERLAQLAVLAPGTRKDAALLREVETDLKEAKGTYEKWKDGFISSRERASIIYSSEALVLFLFYEYGIHHLADKIIHEYPFSYLLEEYRSDIKAFIRKKLDGDNEYFLGDFDRGAMLTIFLVDSHDKSQNTPILQKLKNSRSYEDRINVIKRDRPINGAKRVIFSCKPKVIRYFSDKLKKGRGDELCFPSNLTRRVNPLEVKEYYEILYSELSFV